MESNLKILLEDAKLTPEEFATHTGYTASTIRQMCNSTFVPNLQEAYVVARVLDVPVESVWPCKVQVQERNVTIRSVVHGPDAFQKVRLCSQQ